MSNSNAVLNRLRVKLQNTTSVLQEMISVCENVKDSLKAPNLKIMRLSTPGNSNATANILDGVAEPNLAAPTGNSLDHDAEMRGSCGCTAGVITAPMTLSTVESSGEQFFLLIRKPFVG